MVTIGNKNMKVPMLGTKEVIGISYGTEQKYEKDRTQIKIIYSEDATSADCWYKDGSKQINTPELFDSATKTAVFRFPSSQSLMYAFIANEKIKKINFQKLGTYCKNLMFSCAGTPVEEFIMQDIKTPYSTIMTGFLMKSSNLQNFEVRNCEMPKCNFGVSLGASTESPLKKITVENCTFAASCLNMICYNLINLENAVIKNIRTADAKENLKMSRSFENCSSLKTLDLSEVIPTDRAGVYGQKFVLSPQTFKGCTSLATIKLGNAYWTYDYDSEATCDIDLSDLAMSPSDIYDFALAGRKPTGAPNIRILVNHETYVKNSTYAPFEWIDASTLTQ